jgi:hypothetical protein
MKMTHEETLWPTHDYYQQVEQLRAAVGQALYVVEIHSTAINAGVAFSGTALTLLGIADYPQPDPYRQLCPHLLILDDGRGVNLGRVARISRHTAYMPQQADVLFTNHEFMQNVLLAPRTLSRESAAATSHALLAQLFGDTPGLYLENPKG